MHLAFAEEADRQGFSWPRTQQNPCNLRCRRDVLAVDSRHDVAAENIDGLVQKNHAASGSDPGTFGKASGDDSFHEESLSLGKAEQIGDFGRDLDAIDPERRPMRMPHGDEVGQDAFHKMDGDREAQILCLGYESGGDADDLAGGTQQGPAAVAWIDGGVRLKKGPPELGWHSRERAANGAHHTHGHRVVE